MSGNKRRPFKQWEKDFICLSYPLFSNEDISTVLNRTARVIQTYGFNHNFKKQPKVSIGQKFGKLEVKSEITRNKNGILWLCQCECGVMTRCRTGTLTSGHSQSCGCAKGTGYKDITGTWYGNAKHSAMVRGYKFNLSKEFLQKLLEKQNYKCALSNILISISKHSRNSIYYKETTASLDRIDNSKDYTEDNVQFVHKDVNRMKWAHSQQYFIELCSKVHNANITSQ